MTSPGRSSPMSRTRFGRSTVWGGLAIVLLGAPMGCELTPRNEVPDAPVPAPPRPVVDVRRPTPEQAVRAEVEDAVEFAKGAAEPDRALLFQDIYTDQSAEFFIRACDNTVNHGVPGVTK